MCHYPTVMCIRKTSINRCRIHLLLFPTYQLATNYSCLHLRDAKIQRTAIVLCEYICQQNNPGDTFGNILFVNLPDQY